MVDGAGCRLRLFIVWSTADGNNRKVYRGKVHACITWSSSFRLFPFFVHDKLLLFSLTILYLPIHQQQWTLRKNTDQGSSDASIRGREKLTNRLFAFQTLLDGSRDATEQRVEMTTLRKVCAGGTAISCPRKYTKDQEYLTDLYTCDH